MNFCIRCGSPVGGAKFCGSCGAPTAAAGGPMVLPAPAAESADYSAPADYLRPEVLSVDAYAGIAPGGHVPETTVPANTGPQFTAFSTATIAPPGPDWPLGIGGYPSTAMPGRTPGPTPRMWITYITTGLALVLWYWPSDWGGPLGIAPLNKVVYPTYSGDYVAPGSVTIGMILAFVLLIGGWLAADGPVGRRATAVGILLAAFALDYVLSSGRWSLLGTGPILYCLEVLAAAGGWLVLRRRPAVSYCALILVPALVAPAAYVRWPWQWGPLSDVIGYVLVVASLVGAAWLASLVAVRHERNQPLRGSAAADAAQRQLQSQAAQIRQWQAAYALANPGQPVPVPPVAAGYAAPLSGRTNTFAVLSLVLSFFFSVLGIAFGHVALSQIRRTGESGRGMAIAGLVIGYLSLVASMAFVIFLSVAIHDSSWY